MAMAWLHNAYMHLHTHVQHMLANSSVWSLSQSLHKHGLQFSPIALLSDIFTELLHQSIEKKRDVGQWQNEMMG